MNKMDDLKLSKFSINGNFNNNMFVEIDGCENVQNTLVKGIDELSPLARSMYIQGKLDAIEQILSIAKCEDEDVECWYCAFGDAETGCRLKQL